MTTVDAAIPRSSNGRTHASGAWNESSSLSWGTELWLLDLLDVSCVAALGISVIRVTNHILQLKAFKLGRLAVVIRINQTMTDIVTGKDAERLLYEIVHGTPNTPKRIRTIREADRLYEKVQRAKGQDAGSGSTQGQGTHS